jgi:hypothetical protein
MKIFVYHKSRNCFASIRTYNIHLSTRIANRTHARKRAVSGLVIQITINLNWQKLCLAVKYGRTVCRLLDPGVTSLHIFWI